MSNINSGPMFPKTSRLVQWTLKSGCRRMRKMRLGVRGKLASLMAWRDELSDSREDIYTAADGDPIDVAG